VKSKHAGTLLSLLSLLVICTSARGETPRVEFFIYPHYTKVWKLKGDAWSSRRNRLPFDQFAKLKDVIIKSRQHPTIDPLQFGLTAQWWTSNCGRLKNLFGKYEPQVWDVLTEEKLVFSYDDACYVLKESLSECPPVRGYTFDVKVFDAELPIHLYSDCPTLYKFPWQVEYGSEKWETCDASIPKAIETWLSKPSGVAKRKWPDEIFELQDLWLRQANKLMQSNSSTVLKALPGWNSANTIMELVEVKFHEQSGTVRPNLELRLLFRSPEKSFFRQLQWHAQFCFRPSWRNADN